jgi:protein TonB
MNSGISEVKRLVLIGLMVALAAFTANAQQTSTPTISILDSTREQDGLSGPVRRVQTEVVKLSVKAGNVLEEPRMLLEVTTYDPQGARIANVYYPINTATFKGNQEFAYDDQGHVKEVTLRDDAGRVLSREAISYEFDSFGNWVKMNNSLVIFDGGKLVYEPTETTYRSISYYYDDSVANIVKSSTSPAKNAQSPTTTPVGADPTSTRNSASQALPKSAEARSRTSGPATDPTPELKRGVEVNAGPTAQAYQMPATPPPASRPAVSRGVVDGKPISLPKPIYPRTALANGLFGRVVVEITIDEQGRVVNARALSGNAILRISALAAARLARFEPTLLSGQPVTVTRLIDYDFNKPN